MERVNTFGECHPAVNFCWFASVLVLNMVFRHPVMLVIALLCALINAIWLGGRRALRLCFLGMLPLFLLTVILNPLFSHEGATILLWLPDGNPLTLEAMTFGVFAGIMLVTAILWFYCMNLVLSSDKFIWVVGRAFPTLSMLLSSALRLIPRFRRKMKEIAAVQRSLTDASANAFAPRIRTALRAFSASVTWALENSVETADSMTARGYGLPGRSAYSIYRMRTGDWAALILTAGCTAVICTGAAMGALHWTFYPVMDGQLTDALSIVIYIVYFILGLMPVMISIREERKWNNSISEG